MPLVQRTVYFRKEDVAKWDDVPNKAAWLHEHLNMGTETSAATPATIDTLVQTNKDRKRWTPEDEQRLKDTNVPELPKPAPERLQNGLCKIHDIPLDSRGKCLQRGCKYA